MSLIKSIKWGPTLLASICIAILLLVQIQNVHAQSEPITLGVSPQILDLTANPGDVITNKFRVTNASAEPVVIKAIPKNFTPRGEEGAVDLTEDKTSYSLADWIDVSPETTTIEPTKTKDFAVNITVPQNAEAGSHFGSVVFQTIPPTQDGSAALVSQEIAPVILVRISGDTQESAEIVEFKSGKSFYSNENVVELISRIKNTGDVHFKPSGNITIKNIFGGEVASIELDKRNVLPDSIRQIVTEWQTDGFKVGRYSATLTLFYGENNDVQTATTSFTIFPYQVILPIVIGISILIFVLYKGRTRISKAYGILLGKDENPKDK